MASGSFTRSSGETTTAVPRGRNVHLLNDSLNTVSARQMRSIIARTPPLTPEDIHLIRQRWQAASFSAPGQVRRGGTGD